MNLQDKNKNPPELRDVEVLYERVARMIQGLKDKYRLVNRIQLVEGDRNLFYKFAQGTQSTLEKLQKDAEVFVNFEQNKTIFEVYFKQEVFEIEPSKMKENLMKKQLRELSYKKFAFESKVCRSHDIENDFESNNNDEYKPDDCKDLLKEKFDTFSVYEEQQTVEILKKYLKKSMIDTFNKDLVDLKFYINQNYEVVIEYKINDKSLTLKQKIKRRKWNDMSESLAHIMGNQVFSDLSLTFMEQIFFTEEIMHPGFRSIIVQVVSNQKHYLEKRPQKLFVGFPQTKSNTILDFYKASNWMILAILPKTYNIYKRFKKFKILIIQNSTQLFFLHHENIVENLEFLDKIQESTSDLSQEYLNLIDTVEKKLEWIKLETVSQNIANDQTLFKQVKHTLQQIESMDKIIEIEMQIQNIENQQITMQQQFIDPDDETFILNQHTAEPIEKGLFQLGEQLFQIQRLYNEYKRIHSKVINQIKSFKGKPSVQENKKHLKQFLQRILLEQRRIKERLPIYYHKLDIIEKIKQQQVMLLIGSTGSGKSTQVIQYLLEEIEIKGRIICVEPRILAARSLAKRVAEEMDQKMGGLVQFLGEFGELKDESKIVFTSDRILLNIFQKDPLLSEYDIILIDEAHERNMNTDILLGLTKELLLQRRELKLIIMSATMDQKLFSNYFNCPIKEVEGRMYDVEVLYGEPFQDDYLTRVKQLIQDEVIEKILNGEYEHKHVLVFLSGVDEIQKMLFDFSKYNYQQILFLGLHGQMTTRDQFEVFKNTQKIKVIFSTRLAETALTINDVTIVVDIGVDRFQYFDQQRGFQVTKIDLISKAQADQRKGRAGRTRPGVCYRLYQESEYKSMIDHKTPEIQRSSLDSVVLRIKSFNKSPFQFNFIQKPNIKSMQDSLDYLMEINAVDEKENITTLGKLMSQIQTEPRISRILIEAFYRNVFSEALSIISVMLNNQTLYIKDASIDIKLEQLHENGDFFSFSKIFWEFAHQLNSQKSNAQLRSFCQHKGYHYKTLKTCLGTYNEIEKAFGYFSEQLINNQELKNSISKMHHATREDCVMRCFLSAFHPDICVYNGNPYVGYTFLKSQKNVRIYGSCALSLLNHFPKYIICTDLYQSHFDFCRVAQEVTLDQLKDVLNQEQLQQVEDFIPKSYKYQVLENVPQSLMNHLMLLFTKYYYEESEKRFTHYCNVDKNTGKFEIWSEQEVNLKEYQDKYTTMLQSYHYYKFYGQSMFVQFQHGAEVHSTQVFSVDDLFIIQFTRSPINIDDIKKILDNHDIYYQNVFLQTVNQFGYSGEIYTKDQIETDKIINILNYEAKQFILQNLQYNQLQTDDLEYQKYFFLKKRDSNNKIVRCGCELIFYGCSHQGFGFILFESGEDAEKFLLGTLGIVKIEGREQDLKVERTKNEIKISNVPQSATELEVLRYLQNLGHQVNLPIPMSVRLKTSKNSNPNKNWEPEIKQLIKKHMDEDQCFIKVIPDKNNYKIIARIQNLQNPIKLMEMKKKINLEKNIIGASAVVVDVSFKLMRLVSEKILKQNEKEINAAKQILFEKFKQENIKIIQNKHYLFMIGKNPNYARQANIYLNGLISGYQIRINLSQKVLRKLISGSEFKFALLMLGQKLDIKFNERLLDLGLIVVFVLQERLAQIQQEIQQWIDKYVSNQAVVDVRNYSFKPFLNSQDNLIVKLEQQYKLSIDFNIQQKRVTIYGQNENVRKCKEELLRQIKCISNKIEQGNECEICFSDMTEQHILLLCNHSFCKNCLINHIKSREEFPIRCAHKDCQSISLQDIQQLISESEFNKIIDQSFQTYKNKNDTRYIQCITPDCQEIFLRKQSNQEPFYECQSCLQSFCSECQKFAHPKLTCDEAKQQFFEGKDLDEKTLKSLNIKKCPSCSYGVMKGEGCNHMTCSRCKTHFCWICKHCANTGDDIYEHIRQKHPGKLYD